MTSLSCCLFTGFRKTETARLKWTDIDLVQRVTTLLAVNTKTKKMVPSAGPWFSGSTNVATTFYIVDNRGGPLRKH